MKDKILIWIYSKIWKRWLWNEFTQEYDIVLKVFSWRTARCCNKWHGEVSIRTPCFKILNIKFY